MAIKEARPYRSLTVDPMDDEEEVLATVLENRRVDATLRDHGVDPIDFWDQYWKENPTSAGIGTVTLGRLRDFLGY